MSKSSKSGLKIKLISFGYKALKAKGTDWPKADLYIDCRGVLDGQSMAGGQPASGDKASLQSAVMDASSASIMGMLNMIEDSFKHIPTRRSGEADPYADPYVVAFFCAHGIHRSRASKNLIGKLLADGGFSVEIA